MLRVLSDHALVPGFHREEHPLPDLRDRVQGRRIAEIPAHLVFPQQDRLRGGRRLQLRIDHQRQRAGDGGRPNAPITQMSRPHSLHDAGHGRGGVVGVRDHNPARGLLHGVIRDDQQPMSEGSNRGHSGFSSFRSTTRTVNTHVDALSVGLIVHVKDGNSSDNSLTRRASLICAARLTMSPRCLASSIVMRYSPSGLLPGRVSLLSWVRFTASTSPSSRSCGSFSHRSPAFLTAATWRIRSSATVASGTSRALVMCSSKSPEISPRTISRYNCQPCEDTRSFRASICAAGVTSLIYCTPIGGIPPMSLGGGAGGPWGGPPGPIAPAPSGEPPPPNCCNTCCTCGSWSICCVPPAACPDIPKIACRSWNRNSFTNCSLSARAACGVCQLAAIV